MDIGNCREQHDAAGFLGELVQRDRALRHMTCAIDDTFFVLADGVASSPAPGQASRLAVTRLMHEVARHPEASFDGMVGPKHVRATQRHLGEAAAKRALPRGASTTLVAAHVRSDVVTFVNTGDSRAYVLRSDGRFERMSHDHTELQRLRDEGQALESRRYAGLYNALTDCLVADESANDFAVHRSSSRLLPGDALILCTDGVHDVLGEDEAWLPMLRGKTPLQQVAAIREAVYAQGANDNFSIIVAKPERA
ncbi:PP2C family protein-serine/threonine phosphatase [Dokdonella sp. MW10]|uniref:PP2C family protein-serine/threonine phosphatase n=1 Tax=Dokdonella sp. MW10 TaxID=2992926 RepID=UPI003F7D5563